DRVGHRSVRRRRLVGRTAADAGELPAGARPARRDRRLGRAAGRADGCAGRAAAGSGGVADSPGRGRLARPGPAGRPAGRVARGLGRRGLGGGGCRAVAFRRATRRQTGAALTAQLYVARPTSLLDAVVTYPLGASHPVTTLTTDDLAAPRRRYGERLWDPRLI